MNAKEYQNTIGRGWEEVRGPLLTREEVMYRFREYPDVYETFLELTEEFQEELIAFAMGVKGAKMTYDPFFKHIFNPVYRPEYLEDFLSACFDEEVKILEILPNESKRITEESSLLVADLLVRLKSGAIVNVEIQRIGYYFPGARCACYSSDLVMRQYSQIRAQRRKEKKRFSYGDVKKVYTIVLMQKSTREFHELPDEYLHYAKQTFKSGLKMDLLQEYLLVPLDIFLKLPHNKISRLEAWLYFIASDKMTDIRKVCDAYPDFCELYREVFQFRYHPKELVSMFSEALRILDQDTVQYMIDDMKRELEEQAVQLEEQAAQLEANAVALEAKNAEIEKLKAELVLLNKIKR